jgi:amino acid transporter
VELDSLLSACSAYAVLFTDYLGFYFPQITGWKHYLVSIALVAVITWINIRGIQMVGRVSTALEISCSRRYW